MTGPADAARAALGDAVPGALTGSHAVVGIGVDAVEVARLAAVLGRTPGFAERVYTTAERAYAERRKDSAERYAARFAAKEAALKAMGLGLWSCPLREIEVVRGVEGAPGLVLHGEAARRAAERGIARWALTLTHTEHLALAIAVAFGDATRGAGGQPLAPDPAGRGTLSP